MCTVKTPAKTIAERIKRRDFQRIHQAAARPGIREYARLVAEARRLAFDIDQWLSENPVCELTDTNLALMVAVKDAGTCDDITPEFHRALSSMAWTLNSGTDFLTSCMYMHAFPECFERLKRKRRKPQKLPLALTA